MTMFRVVWLVAVGEGRRVSRSFVVNAVDRAEAITRSGNAIARVEETEEGLVRVDPIRVEWTEEIADGVFATGEA